MTEQEARKLLPMFADGLLRQEEAKAVEAALAVSPPLQAELRKLKEENDLLTEALAPLRPTRSARMRVTEAMQLAAEDMHRRATKVAEALPEKGWRVFRLSFAAAALIIAVMSGYLNPPGTTDGESTLGQFVSLGLFATGIVFLVAGSLLVQLEARLMGLVTHREEEPTRLETLILEVFGILSIVAAGILQFWR